MFPGKKTVVYTYILGLFVVTTPYWHSALTFLIFFLVSESPLCWRWGCQEAKHFSRAQLWLYNGVSFWTKKNTQHWQLLAPWILTCQKLNFCPILPHDRRPHGIQQFSLVCAAIFGHFSNRTHGFACDQPIESCPCQDPFEYKLGLQYSFSLPFSKLNNKFFTLFRFLLLQFFRFVSLTLKKI